MRETGVPVCLAVLAVLMGCDKESSVQHAERKPAKKIEHLARPLPSTYGDAVRFASHGDFTSAARIWRQLAGRGDNRAADALGDMYVTGGHGVSASMPEALKWYRLAADHSDARGEFMIGLAHDSGEGLTQNYGEALNWYLRSARDGSPYAEEFIGKLYAGGRGVAQSDLEAHTWFNLAAAHGDASAVKERDSIEARLSAPQLEEAQEMARACSASHYRKCGEAKGVGPASVGEVPLKDLGGVFKIPVLINEAISLDFIIDSGASDVSIPADVVLTLVRAGTISASDSIGSQTYTLADGSSAPSERFLIHSLKLGSVVLHNVAASIGDTKGVPLLGQSFLSRFKSWSIDNARHMLLLGARAADAFPDTQTAATVEQPSAQQPIDGAALTATETAHPSFECGHPKYVAETTICNNPTLAAMDIEYAAKWMTIVTPLRARGANAQYLTVRDRARSFLAERNACGTSAVCISQAYQSILTFFGSLSPRPSPGPQ